MARKPGPKTETLERQERKVVMLDPLTQRMLAVLADQHAPRNESRAVRDAIRLAYDRYQRAP
jgi:hypothetical protein